MIWWDWTANRRRKLIALMLALAASPWLLIDEVFKDWREMAGGTALLFIAQIVAWLLYVGLATGRMPSGYSRAERRSEAPIWFWATGVAYAGVLLMLLWMIVITMSLGL